MSSMDNIWIKNAPSPLPKRQVCRAGVRTQTLSSASDDDGDRLAGAAFEDVRARLLRDGADAHRKDDVTVERHAEVGRQREEVRDDAREGGGEACTYTTAQKGA